ncbi:MAG TPA: SPOR domain-containing protein [bacterium]|nr:SPOR domain-containing protein [bacterium]
MFIHKIFGETTVRQRLSLPDGYRVREIEGQLYLFDPRGIPLAGPANAATIDKCAWRDVWRHIDDELREEMAALHAGDRSLHTLRRVRQYLHMVDAVNHHERAATARPIRREVVHWGALAVSAALAAALMVGPIRIGPVQERPGPLTTPVQHAAPVSATRPESSTPAQRGAASPVAARRMAARPLRPAHAARLAVRPRARPAYGVVVGAYPDAAEADSVMHLVRSKGYIVDVVPRGTVAQVVTPPYRTRIQAERVARALEDIGLPARLTALGAP